MKTGRFAVFAVVLAALLTPQPVSADPTPAQLRKLTKEAAALNNRYRGSIQSLEEIKVQAKKALDTSGHLQKRLADAQGKLAAIAQTSYMLGPIDGTQLFATQVDPYKTLGHAANMNFMAQVRAGQVAHVQKLIADSQKAKLAANDKIKKMQKEIKAIKSRRAELDRLLAKYGFQQPGGGEGLTPRMIAVRAEIMQNFPVKSVGCLRPGDPGEHGKGRACDFMMSTGGSVASGFDAANGDAISNYLIKNGQRMGVMYIIWKQRYYDIRSGGGWDPMSDRGGATANHYDHVHVSVF
ncbi:hypothetical protein [Nonomuraea sp. NPDC023979]|uniref:hypothetical protein n=1 Tax=Nonomuraea sp. NPDC023979 TaxID=3154796 RepID=UPI0033ECDA03